VARDWPESTYRGRPVDHLFGAAWAGAGRVGRLACVAARACEGAGDGASPLCLEWSVPGELLTLGTVGSGRALAAHGRTARPTQDLDLFTSPGRGDVAATRAAFAAATR